MALRRIPSVNETEHGDFVLSDSLTEREKVRVVVRIDLHLDGQNVASHIDLGLATPGDIPPAPPLSSPVAAPVPVPATQRRTL
ncbi:hypothetical protein J5J01_00270 [Streptomyces fradiae]|uniref:hypothetical protein n=1 Tax=Streptomyces fradiae TaxID=1906 RepID=UPI002019EC02|nr:hypothetical protein [Streptomyces fradiae]UQS32997.1 hypothetical protein J5J01_00270 [Streptomyces fradiae]